MANYKRVSYGSQGDDVKTLQEKLNSYGYNLTVDGIFGANTKNAVEDYQKNNGLDVDGVVGTNTWGALDADNTATATNAKTSAATTATAQAQSQSAVPTTEAKPESFTYTPYEKSDVVKQAEAMVQQQMANRPGEYQSQWQTQLNDMIQKILNREDFSYDMNADALYQQYKDQYINQGKMAMMDTMGQAQAMTGGYGSSYAQSVGQQAYQGYLQHLNDKIPELYQLALNQYNAEGDVLNNKASILAQMEDQDYGRHRDNVSDYNAELDRLTENARYQSEQDYSRWADEQGFAYQQHRDAESDRQWQASFDEGIRQYNEQMALASSGGSTKGTSESGDNTNYEENNTEQYISDMVSKAADAAKKVFSGEATTPKEKYKNWDGGQWEAYFASIRQEEGQAAAEAELNDFTSKGYIPEQYVSMAAIGARGGSKGH